MKGSAVSVAPDPTRYRLTTAQIVYRLPDEPDTLQTFIWQKFDIAPEFPELSKFLDFWRLELEGELHSVRVTSARLMQPPAYRSPGAWLRLH